MVHIDLVIFLIVILNLFKLFICAYPLGASYVPGLAQIPNHTRNIICGRKGFPQMVLSEKSSRPTNSCNVTWPSFLEEFTWSKHFKLQTRVFWSEVECKWYKSHLLISIIYKHPTARISCPFPNSCAKLILMHIYYLCSFVLFPTIVQPYTNI